MSKVNVGIDLGTTNTVCCRFDTTKMDIVRFNGKELLPSILYYRDGTILIGRSAVKKRPQYPECIIQSSKRYIGTDRVWNIQDKTFSPTDVAEHILREVASEVKKRYDADDISAVITVPVSFSSKQYEETKKAAEAAGIEVIEILPEPMAAAIAYGINNEKPENLFIFDFGGGTFDVAIILSKDDSFEQINSDGDRELGGDDIDQLLIERCYSFIRRKIGINLSSYEKSRIDDFN